MIGMSHLLRFFCEYLLHITGTSEKFDYSTISLPRVPSLASRKNSCRSWSCDFL